MTRGEMKKAIGEMENEISKALRSSDPQIGFEIICKKLSKLEKENEELNEIRNGQARIINNDTDRIEKLEKEIAELKAQIEKMKCCHSCKNCEINFTNDSGIKYGCKKLRHKSDDCILNDYHCWELAE